MTDQPPEISILDARLAEIDRRLSSIQTGLAADLEDDAAAGPPSPAPPAAEAEPAPAPPPPEPAPELPPRAEHPPHPAVPVVDELRQLAGAHEQLLRSTRELLAAYERLLSRLEPAPAAPSVREFSVSAGPFGDTEALRGFERTLSRIPEVRDVAVRGYEGEDRAIVDVQLFGPNT